MKRNLLLLAMLLSAVMVYADKDIKFFMNTGEIKCVAQERVDSIVFDEDAGKVTVTLHDGSGILDMAEIDSIKYGILPPTVEVIYMNEKAIVENPFAFDSVAVEIDGAKVVVMSSTLREIGYTLHGCSGDGCFKLYGLKKYNLYLNGVELTNGSGAAINSQCGKRGRIFVADGTVNRLADSSSYSTVSGEDEKASFFSEGQLIFEGGSGKLIINGNCKHAICSDDYVEVRGGNIIVESAESDALHVNDSVIVLGGLMDFKAGGDGIDCDGVIRLHGGKVVVMAENDDVKGIKSASDIIIDGADVSVTVSGTASKGIKSNGLFEVSNGNVVIEATGNSIATLGDPSYATCIKCDSTVNINGGNISLKATGIAGRGISSDVDVNIIGGALVVECSGDSETYVPTTEEDILGGSEEEEKSYVVYVSIPASGASNRPGSSSSAWKSVYLYDSSNSLVAVLSNSMVVNGTTFYYYDFGTEMTGSYYFKSDDYSSFRGTYAIQSSVFTGLDSDRYYQISSSYTTSGSVRTYSLSDVTSSYEGGSVSSSGSATEDSYAAAGIKCDKNFILSGGSHLITMHGTESKGIKVEGNAVIDGGKLEINTSGAARIIAYDPSYCTAIKCDGTLEINGGEVEITAAGQGGHGISADGTVTMNGGTVNITLSGSGSSYTASSGTDYYSTKCLKGDVAVNLLEGTLNCLAKGNGSKAIVAGGLLTIGNEGAANELLNIRAVTQGASLSTSSGNTGMGGMGGMQEGFNAAPKAIKGAANVVVNSGTIYTETAYDGGEGLESKATMTINGGIVECNTYDDGINAATSLIFNGGYIFSHVSNNDAIDSNGTITVNGGVVLASGTNAPEEGFDCDNNQFAVNGGIIIGTGSANSSVTSSSQPYASVSSVSVTQGRYLAVKNSSGEVMFSYRCPNTVNGASVLLSSPAFTSSSHTLMYGVTSVSGASESYFDGSFTVGGTASGGSSKSFTPQSR